MTISVQWTGPELVPAANATRLEDYHLHYFLDEDATPYLNTSTLTPVPMGNPRIVHTANLQVPFEGVPAGSHTVTV
ncbi:MAG: hypothetical protein JOZ81_11610, partial [Chloroflexi bacterium]|nr:hypothetical protein [Chloroflexota bacterium]